MRIWYKPALAAACALLAAPLLAYALPDDKEDKEKAEAHKELKELEAQRSKLDDRIRAARKKAGVSGDAHGFVFSDGKLKELYGLGGDHEVIVKKALGTANEAVKKALENMPKHEKFEFNFDLDHDGKAFKFFADKDGAQIFTDKDGKIQKRKMTDEEKKQFEAHMKKFHEQMGKMKIDLHENLKGLKELKVYGLEGERLKNLKDLKIEIPKIRAFSDGKIYTPKGITPETRIFTAPRLRGGEDSELRDEIRSLREEVQRLRDEVRKGRSGRSTSTNLDPFGPV